MQNARWAYAILGIGFILLMLGFGAFNSKDQTQEGVTVQQAALPQGSLTFGKTVIAIEIADTPETRTKGLSGRQSLEEGKGLFFVFEEPGTYGFWMPNMHFPIDIIWLDAAYKVVYIKENATPDSYPTVFEPTAPALYVLEVPAFYASKNGIKVGSTASLVQN